MRALRRFRWADVPKRRRQLTYVGVFVTGVTATMQYKFTECIEIVGNPARISNPHFLFWLRMLFGRARSRWFGALSELHVPVALRLPLYRLFAWTYDVNLEEVRYPLDSFGTFQEFFCRTLREGARPIADVPSGLVSPVDGKVLTSGVIRDAGARVEQVKGATYSVPSFLGTDPAEAAAAGSTIRYVVLYLAPGNYHRIHAPCSLDFFVGRHFCGELLPVRPSFLQWVNDVFTVNERVVLSGSWRFGQMHLVAVGATNVGNIFLDFDPKLKTNRMRDIANHLGGDLSTKKYHDGVHLDAGDTVGGFRLGSTVVLIFETAQNFQWRVAQGDVVRVGQPLGEVP